MSKAKFIKLVLDSTYYINHDDINYIVWNDADDADIKINVNRSGENISVGKYVIIEPTIGETRTVESPNLELIRELVLDYITAPTVDGIMYINQNNLSYIHKTEAHCAVKFRNATGLTTDKLNTRGKIKM